MNTLLRTPPRTFNTSLVNSKEESLLDTCIDCSKSSYITLEPGDLKDVNLKNETVQYYSDFLRSLNWITAGTGFRRQKAGDSILIALEERLNSGSANPIIVNYEAETSILAYCTTGRVDPIVKSFGVASISM